MKSLLATLIATSVLLVVASNSSTSAAEISDPNCQIKSFNNRAFPIGFPRPTGALLGEQSISLFVIPYSYTDIPFTQRDYENSTSELEQVKKFIEANSYGKVKVTAQIAAESNVVNLPIKSNDFTYSNQFFAENANFQAVDDLILKIINGYKGSENLSNFTVVGMVSPSFPAYGLGFSGKPEGYETSKGKINKTYLKFGEVAQVPTLTFHELNHSLFGLPDLYNHPAATVGKPKYLATAGWGIMSNLGNYAKNYFAWEKYLSGWLSSDQVKCVSAKTKIKVKLSPQADSSAGVKMLVVKVSETKALVIEYRVPGLGFDGMNVKQGALVYLVDGAIESGKDPVKVLTKPDITTLKNKESIKYSNVKITQVSGNNSGITIQVN